MIDTITHDRVLRRGLVPPGWACERGTRFNGRSPKVAQLATLQLSKAPHPWPAVDRVERDLTRKAGALVLAAEEELLGIFHLPRMAAIEDSLERIPETLPAPGDERFPTITRSDVGRMERVFEGWLAALVGEPNAAKLHPLGKQLDLADLDDEEQELGILIAALRRAFRAGAERTRQQIQRLLGRGGPELTTSPVAQDLLHTSLLAMLEHGLTRVRDLAILEHRRRVLEILLDGERDGLNPLTVARQLHRELAGQLWKWQRLARSETVLAVNEGVKAEAIRDSVEFFQWSCAEDSCPVCDPLCGQTWAVGAKYPEPVADTHPNCRCSLNPIFMLQNRTVQSPWSFGSPYEGGVPWLDLEPDFIQ